MNQTIVNELYGTKQWSEDILDQLGMCYDDDGQIVDQEEFNRLQKQHNQAIGKRDDLVLDLGRHAIKLRQEKKAVLDQEKRFESHKKSIDRQIEYIKGLVEANLDDGVKIDDGLVTIKRKPELKLHILNEKEIPSEYMKSKYSNNPIVPDKEKIEKALKSKINVAGCTRTPIIKLVIQ